MYMYIILDTDNTLNYEVNSPLRKVLNIVLVPILNILPSSTKIIIQKSHRDVSNVVDNATNHKALEILYKNSSPQNSSSWMKKMAHMVWFGTNNSKAVRNRLRLVTRELKLAIKYTLDKKDNIYLLSIASGSARAVIEALSNVDIYKDKIVNVFFLDKNPMALEYSKGLLKEYSLLEDPRFRFTWMNGNAGTLIKAMNQNSIDIVEMVGLLDYFDDKKAKSIFSDIHNILSIGGIFITANINDNSEKKFMTKVIKWPMIYRTCDHLGELLISAGFKKTDVRLHYEPLKIHGVAISKKT